MGLCCTKTNHQNKAHLPTEQKKNDIQEQQNAKKDHQNATQPISGMVKIQQPDLHSKISYSSPLLEPLSREKDITLTPLEQSLQDPKETVLDPPKKKTNPIIPPPPAAVNSQIIKTKKNIEQNAPFNSNSSIVLGRQPQIAKQVSKAKHKPDLQENIQDIKESNLPPTFLDPSGNTIYLGNDQPPVSKTLYIQPPIKQSQVLAQQLKANKPPHEPQNQAIPQHPEIDQGNIDKNHQTSNLKNNPDEINIITMVDSDQKTSRLSSVQGKNIPNNTSNLRDKPPNHSPSQIPPDNHSKIAIQNRSKIQNGQQENRQSDFSFGDDHTNPRPPPLPRQQIPFPSELRGNWTWPQCCLLQN